MRKREMFWKAMARVRVVRRGGLWGKAVRGTREMNWKAADRFISWKRLFWVLFLGLIGGILLPSRGHGVDYWVAMLFIAASCIVAMCSLVRSSVALFERAPDELAGGGDGDGKGGRHQG